MDRPLTSWWPHPVVVLAALTISVGATSACIVLYRAGSPLLSLLIGPLAAGAGLAVSSRRKYVMVGRIQQRLERRFEAIIHASPDFLFVFDSDGRIDYHSPSVTRAMGGREVRHLDELLEWVQVDDADQLRRFFAAPRHAPDSVEITIDRTPDGDEPPAGLDPLRVLSLRLTDERSNADVQGIVVLGRDVTDEARLRTRLAQQALEDDLTGLANRRALHAAGTAACGRAARFGSTMGLVVLDLDGFKGINDTLGHPFGDRLLCQIAERLQETARAGETVGRIGGDEFAVVLERCTRAEGLAAAERFIEALRVPYQIDDELLGLGCSAGAVTSRDADEVNDLFRRADIALYEAKRTSPGTAVAFTDDLEQLLVTETRLARAIETGLTRGEFSVCYQPQVTTDGFELVGFEALARWESPQLGVVSPAAFIPVAERSGAIIELGAVILREACTQLQAWAPLIDDERVSVAVNVSPRQLYDERFVDMVSDVLDETGLPSRKLVLEVTESLVVDHAESVARRLEAVRALGVRIALDDFGTGYSSLSRLQSLPVDTIKIDRSFIEGSTASAHGATVLTAILDLGRSLDVTVVAEGVETEAQMHQLMGPGCDVIQGFLFERPLPPDQVAELLREQGDGGRRSGAGVSLVVRASDPAH